MDDLISRQEAITLPIMPKEYRKHKPIDCDDAYEQGWSDCQSCIGRLPTAQPERKTGRWILHENQRQEDVDNGNYLYICSECGKSDIHAKTQEVPFCWWCGSKMEVEHDG